jgi:uncharacterized repeat protein (TIGR01451 family)
MAALLWNSATVMYGQARVLTWHNDNARTGQNLQETVLTPANVNTSSFGRLFTISVDQRVDAQPLYVPSLAIPNQGTHNVLFVVTEHDSVYAFDADTGTQLWHVSLLLSGEAPSDDRGCGQVSPEMGITSTPAIDLQMGPHGTMYVVAMSKNGSTYHQRLHALDLTTGAEEFGGPVAVQATYPGNGDGSVGGVLTFDPKQYKERAGLLIWNGTVYTSWASHCDFFPYTAWVIGYNEASLSRASVLNLTPNGSDGSVWAAGAGPAADAGGNIYLLIANGTFDTTLNGSGFPNNGDYGNAFVKIATGGVSVADYFTMSNTAMESSQDQDLGSGGAMLLPSLNDNQGHPRDLAVGAGKDANIYVVDRAGMGKFNANTNAIYQELPSGVTHLGSVFSSPAWFNGTLYYGAVNDTLKAFAFSNGMFGTIPASHTALSFPYPGATPSISANGTANGIVWAAENGGPAVLHAYDATNLATELYNSNQAPNNRDHFGTGNKFIVPTVVNGKVYVGTTNGVGVFGLLSISASPLLGISKTHSGDFVQGQQNATYTVTISNATGAATTSGTVTVTETVPSGLFLVSMSGTGWTCPGTATNNCTRSDTLNGGASYAPITVTVNIASNASSPVTNQVNVSGGGSATASATDSTNIIPSSSDLAQGKTATQSSTYDSRTGAANAVDGNTDGNYLHGSISHTNLDANAWWQVDLGTSAAIGSISIWNRTDCCPERLNDYWVFVSDTPFLSSDTPATLQNRAGTWSSHQTSFPYPSTTITLNAQGRYVRVQLSGTNYLSLAEVQVFAASQNPDLAQGRTATQSSTYDSRTGAANAVDGNTDGNYLHGSISHTNLDANAWWQVDLGTSAAIGSISIWNRTDCCPQRLNDYWVFVSDTPFLSSDTPATLQSRAGTWSSHQAGFPNPSTTITLNAQGRYVRVQLSGTNYLSLAEVQVYGAAP